MYMVLCMKMIGMEHKLQCITVELFANATKMTMFGVNGLQYTTNKIVTPFLQQNLSQNQMI